MIAAMNGIGWFTWWAMAGATTFALITNRRLSKALRESHERERWLAENRHKDWWDGA